MNAEGIILVKVDVGGVKLAMTIIVSAVALCHPISQVMTLMNGSVTYVITRMDLSTGNVRNVRDVAVVVLVQ